MHIFYCPPSGSSFLGRESFFGTNKSCLTVCVFLCFINRHRIRNVNVRDVSGKVSGVVKTVFVSEIASFR